MVNRFGLLLYQGHSETKYVPYIMKHFSKRFSEFKKNVTQTQSWWFKWHNTCACFYSNQLELQIAIVCCKQYNSKCLLKTQRYLRLSVSFLERLHCPIYGKRFFLNMRRYGGPIWRSGGNRRRWGPSASWWGRPTGAAWWTPPKARVPSPKLNILSATGSSLFVRSSMLYVS